ncbi:MAG: hypothetical protein AAF998_02810 [Bacteroidota bacterium]
MGKILRKRFDLPTVQNDGDSAKETFELDKHTERVTGIIFTADREDMLFVRGTVGVLINGEEVIPEGYHTKLLMSGLGVAPKDKYLPLDLDPGNGILKVSYQDVSTAILPFSSYTVSVYVEYEIDENAA